MRHYVKGFVFALTAFIVSIHAHALVIGPFILISAVKVVVALVSMLAVPVTGIIHYFVRGSILKKVLIILSVLMIIGVAAYLFISPNIGVFNKKASITKNNVMGDSADNVGRPAPYYEPELNSSNSFMPPVNMNGDITDKFIELLVFLGLGTSLAVSFLIALIKMAFLKITGKEIVMKDLLIRSLIWGTFLGIIGSFVVLVMFIRIQGTAL